MNEGNESRGTKEIALFLVALFVGGLLFAAFSFLTFGLPLVVLVLSGLIWMYVGLMRWVDRLVVKRADRRRSQREPSK